MKERGRRKRGRHNRIKYYNIKDKGVSAEEVYRYGLAAGKRRPYVIVHRPHIQVDIRRRRRI